MKTTKTFPKGTEVNDIFVFVDDCLAGDCLAGDDRLIEGDLDITKIVNITIETKEETK